MKGTKLEDSQRFGAVVQALTKSFLCTLFLWSKKSLDVGPTSLLGFIDCLSSH